MRILWLAPVVLVASGGLALAQTTAISSVPAGPTNGVAAQGDATAMIELKMADAALGRQEKAIADVDLTRAQTLLVTRIVPRKAGSTPRIPVDHSPAYGSVAKARADLQANDLPAAQTDTQMGIRKLQNDKNGEMESGSGV